MGQSADSGRNASLDEQKERAAGRRGRTGQHEEAKEQIKDTAAEPAAQPAEGATGGAFGRDNHANRKGGVGTRGGGGGGGENSSAKANHLNVGTSKRTARKRT